MESEGNSDILLLLGEIKGEVKGINQRLDVSNHRTEKVENRVTSLESTRDQQKGGWRVTTVIAGAVSTAVYFILGKTT